MTPTGYFLDHLWLIPLFPLATAALMLLFGKRLPNSGVSVLCVGSVGLSFLYAVGAVLQLLAAEPDHRFFQKVLFEWLTPGPMQMTGGHAIRFVADWGYLLDPLSCVMVLVVTGVGFLIHIYSIGYMGHEGGYYRFFGYMNLFMFAMLTLVLANNMLLMFVGWEGVGLCSYLLIGFYFLKKSASDAGKKAFIVNRIGDAGFILGILLTAVTLGTVRFTSQGLPDVEGASGILQALKTAVDGHALAFGAPVLTGIALLLFIGAMVNSAQIPLYVWLPDAMEGPTPVSALIHAATMVTAGVYMVARSAALFNHAPGALLVVSSIGAATAIFAASIGLVQTDIKRVLAYSTVSQLGYMFLACGAGAYAAGIFHLMTHAFFKALLFLAAGSVIHGMGGIQDVRKMGGLARLMPWTHKTFLVGTLAIGGFPPLAGFFSKDAVLWGAWNYANYGRVLWFVGVLAASFTSFYMFRLLILTFYGTPRYTEQEVHHLHESPNSMLMPLVILAVCSILAGFAGVPPVLGGDNHIQQFLTPAAHEVKSESIGTTAIELILMAVSTGAALAGAGLAYLFYIARPTLPETLSAKAHSMYSIMLNKFYVDEIYDAVVVWPVVRMSSEFLWKFVDMFMIDGAVNGIGQLVRSSGSGLRYMQS